MPNKRTFTLIAISLLAISITGCFPLVSATEERTATFPLTGKLSLIIDGRNGHIDIRGSAGVTEVQVTAKLTAGASNRSEAEDLLSRIDLEMTQNGNEVTLRHRADSDFNLLFNRNEGVSFEVVVPMDADLNLSTSNGHIDIRSINGSLSASTSNGHIDVSEVHGDLSLASSNGRIDVHDGLGALEANTSNGAIHFDGRLIGAYHSATTSNGAISFAIPADQELAIDARTSNGRIRSSLPLSGDRDGKHWSATLNSPSAQLKLTTSNGSISINELR